MSQLAYMALARKWRPAQLADVIGQDAVVRTLNNAVLQQRIHPAYLFTGSRGVGKTSIARIFAKLMRCESVIEKEGFLFSCDRCTQCLEISRSQSVDVLEIDGASNNGVEAIREIRENVKYAPQSGARKVYIIDEVHMLSTAAFNALLKTLEEPPAHIVFIFATTEPHKVPSTILSRCQRFDYRRVRAQQIQQHLQKVASSEGVSVEWGALELLATASDGSVRDALSLLDQVIAFSGSTLSLQKVREGLGLIESQALLGILRGILQRKPLEACEWIAQVEEKGHDLRLCTQELLKLLHALILLTLKPTEGAHAIGGGKESSIGEQEGLSALVGARELEELELIFQVFHHGLEGLARSPQPKLVLDVLAIKCATADALIRLDAAPISSGEFSAASIVSSTSLSPSNSLSNVLLPKPIAVGESTPAMVVSSTLPRSGTVCLPDPGKTWEGWVEHVRKARPLLASILEHAREGKVPLPEGQSTAHSRDDEFPNPGKEERQVILYFAASESYFREQLQSKIYQEPLIHLIQEYFGKGVRLRIELKNEGESLLMRKERTQKEFTASLHEKVHNHPILLEARSLFGGELGPIKTHEVSRATPSA